MSDSPDDECQCGDYRRDHKDSAGACRYNSREFDINHGGKNCYQFRAAIAKAGGVK